MVLRNYSIVNSSAVRSEGKVYDLHNFYDFSSLQIDLANKKLMLIFSVANGFVVETNQEVVVLTFGELYYLEFSVDFFVALPCDLAEIGFKKASDFDHDWLNVEPVSNGGDHFFLRFTDDHFIRVGSFTALLTNGEKELTGT
jgi:hypothetical protein